MREQRQYLTANTALTSEKDALRLGVREQHKTETISDRASYDRSNYVRNILNERKPGINPR